jgi:hypothetical protein
MELKRFTRPEFLISVAGHVGGLLILLLVGANSFESKLPDAMMVEIVPPNEFARFQGLPVDATSSGVATSSDSNSANTSTQPQPPGPTVHPPQQPRQQPNPQHDVRQVAAPPQTAQPDTAQPDTALPRASEPLPAPTAKLHSEETPDGRGVGEEFAMPLVPPGGRLGGGFDASAINAPKVERDYTTLFRERVSSCSRLPLGIARDEDIRVALLVSFKPDGTLAWTPVAIGPMFSPKAPALLQSAIDALQRCQPYTMLPPEKYNEWKSLPLTVTPINFPGR